MLTPKFRLAALCGLVAACGTPSMKPDDDHDHSHEAEYTLGRLVVADGPTGQLTVIDLDDRTTSGTLMLEAPGTVYANLTSEGGFVYATQRMQNRTNILESGIEFDAHDDHFHLKKKAPSLKPTAISGAMPTHFTFNQGWATLFNDGDGTVDFISEAMIARNELTPRRATTGTAHHGVALVHGERLVATMSMANTLPDGGVSNVAAGATERAKSAVDTVMNTFSGCPSLHGEYTAGANMAFGCADGVLVLRWNAASGRFDSTKIPNPAGRMERVGTVEGSAKLPVFIGNFDRAPANGLAIIDPRNNSITPMSLPTRRFAFRVDEPGEHILVLTMDGRLHRFKLNAAQTELVADGAPLQVIPAYDTWPATPPRPAMAIGWDRAYVSDPRDGTVKEVKIEEWKVEHSFSVGGTPASLTVTSMSPDWESKDSDGHSHP